MFGRYLPSAQLDQPAGTRPHTCSARDAPAGRGTDAFALAAVPASFARNHALYAPLQPLWVVTPPAAQRTSLHEYHAAYARPVVYSEFLNVKYHAAGRMYHLRHYKRQYSYAASEQIHIITFINLFNVTQATRKLYSIRAQCAIVPLPTRKINLERDCIGLYRYARRICHNSTSTNVLYSAA